MIPEDVISAISELKNHSYELSFTTRVNMDSKSREVEWAGSYVCKTGKRYNYSAGGFSQMVIGLHNLVFGESDD